ncbi:MAG: YqgE/AlgH family protein [Steroidobacteraceae bacterium]
MRKPPGNPILAGMRPDTSLSNHLLIAMPTLSDGDFSQSVTLICEHSDKGALGIILNKPLTMSFGDVLAQMSLDPATPQIAAQSVLRGGPVHTDRGFVLHRPGGDWDSSHRVSESVQVTTSRDILAALARGEGPRNAFIALGYAGWEAGQLEREMLDNAWLSLPVNDRLVFDMPYEERWQAAWQLIGVDSKRISHLSGHA